MKKRIKNLHSNLLNSIKYFCIFACLFVGISFSLSANKVGIVANSSLEPEAEIRLNYLNKIYQNNSFEIVNDISETGSIIFYKINYQL